MPNSLKYKLVHVRVIKGSTSDSGSILSEYPRIGSEKPKNLRDYYSGKKILDCWKYIESYSYNASKPSECTILLRREQKPVADKEMKIQNCSIRLFRERKAFAQKMKDSLYVHLHQVTTKQRPVRIIDCELLTRDELKLLRILERVNDDFLRHGVDPDSRYGMTHAEIKKAIKSLECKKNYPREK